MKKLLTIMLMILVCLSSVAFADYEEAELIIEDDFYPFLFEESVRMNDAEVPDIDNELDFAEMGIYSSAHKLEVGAAVMIWQFEDEIDSAELFNEEFFQEMEDDDELEYNINSEGDGDILILWMEEQDLEGLVAIWISEERLITYSIMGINNMGDYEDDYEEAFENMFAEYLDAFPPTEDIAMPEKSLGIYDVILSPGDEVKPGRALLTSVILKNYGTKDIDAAKIEISIPGLDISASEYAFDIDAGEIKESEELYMRIPVDAEEDEYQLEIRILVDGILVDSDYIEIEVEDDNDQELDVELEELEVNGEEYEYEERIYLDSGNFYEFELEFESYEYTEDVLIEVSIPNEQYIIEASTIMDLKEDRKYKEDFDLYIPSGMKGDVYTLRIEFSDENEAIIYEYEVQIYSDEPVVEPVEQKIELELSQVRILDEVVRAGDDLIMKIHADNTGSKDLEDVRATVVIPELSLRKQIKIGDIDSDDDEADTLYLHIPEYTEPGVYDVRVTISNDDIRRVIYREVFVE